MKDKIVSINPLINEAIDLDDQGIIKLKSKEITRYIGVPTQCMLWGRAAGRCEFNGCNKILYRSTVTQELANLAEKAHIYSFSEEGPRGRGKFAKNEKDLNNLENLMLVCESCHKVIDTVQKTEKYNADLISGWKKEHEQRVEVVTGITSDKKTHVIFYESNIHKNSSRLDKREAYDAIFPDHYPVSPEPIRLSMDWKAQDNQDSFWTTESNNLNEEFTSKIEPLLREREQPTLHFTLFALASMPLLIKLGSLFTDKVNVNVRQRLREPATWRWQEAPTDFDFVIKEPENFDHPPVLIFSLTDKIEHKRVFDVLRTEVSIWEMTADEQFRGSNMIISSEQLGIFRTKVRNLLNRIRKEHGLATTLSIFPTMSISCSIELGRVRMPKVEMPWDIYDHNSDAKAFIKTITLGGER